MIFPGFLITVNGHQGPIMVMLVMVMAKMVHTNPITPDMHPLTRRKCMASKKPGQFTTISPAS
jgi:hypothetical protein